MLGLNSTLGFLLSLGIFTSDTSKPIVQTEYGKLEGTTSTGRDGRTIYEFLGIPYAKPPINELRFRAPVEWNTTWDGVRDATEYGSKCKQFHLIGKFLSGSENCLFLNIYTHNYPKEERSFDNSIEKETSKDKLSLVPVVVYLHGGLFMHGSGEWYKPKYMLDSDVVLVTINYRLGAFGFLNLGAEGINGNAGLKDIVAGLKYIQRNIRNFGGDPNKVTIMGESAGGACVHYLLLSPLARGLFHRAISQSGNAFTAWGSQDNPQEQALMFASQMNCLKSSMAKTAKCLRNLDADKIGRGQRAAADILHHRYALYAPTVELPAEDAFISDKPENIIKSGNFPGATIPWIIGVNSEEGLIYSAPILRNETIRAELNKNWTYWAPILFRFTDEPNKEEIAVQMRTQYLGNSSTEISMNVLHNLTTFLSDRSFFEGLHNTLELHRGQQPIYPYIYGYEGKFSFAKLVFGLTFALPVAADVVVTRTWKWFLSNVFRVPETSYGVAHGDELPLFFNLPFQSELLEKGKTYSDYDMSKTLVGTWTAFARDGVPPPINNISWPLLTPVDPEASNCTEIQNQPIKFLKINRVCEIIDEPFHTRKSFWRKLNLLPYKRQTDALEENCNKTESIIPLAPPADSENIIEAAD